MENRKSPSKKKLLPDQEEKVRQVKCDIRAAPGSSKKQLLLDLVTLLNKRNQQPLQQVHPTVHPRGPAIKTLFIAEKRRFNSTKKSDKSRSVLGIGDHLSFSTHFADTPTNSGRPIVGDKKQKLKQEISEKTFDVAFYQQVEDPPDKLYDDKTKLGPEETCFVYVHRHETNHHNLKQNINKKSNFERKNRKLIDADCSTNKNLSASIIKLNNKVEYLKSLVRTQEMVLGDRDSHNSLSSSDEESRDNMPSRYCGPARPGCSYTEHYSHIPETSAFQRYAQQSRVLSPSKGATIEKEHNSEQYGRDFTTYDGLTARGRRQCASVTSKRDDFPQAAERITKIRHKLNPVRDYRLMDTVHYLAQGEFAPRNDGIKLTPSREAVLSDIIWEDVCRTHWPTARLGRRHTQERTSTRSELQRLIDSLLRERVAHVERRRRRHYRIVKHTQHSAGRVGKTGDIIVASGNNKHRDDDAPTGYTHHASGLMMSSIRWPDHRSHKSADRLMSPERRRVVQEECTPGPSYAVTRSRREPTCCYHAAGPSRKSEEPKNNYATEKYSSSSTASSDKHKKNPRLIVKKDSSRKKHHEKELNLEHFILLPTLVVRTPSNVRRQKKFNELYHRILNQLSTDKSNRSKGQVDADSQCNCKKDSVTSINHGKNK
ncbi:uncharacterized protein LOC134669917 [Cydia fagiglandana]|uniref:uncharacterized protein LOC134669917 n=1 Tax=Cydia fagiglandana TaxID=1458189 RepID=UPI002FEE14C8